MRDTFSKSGLCASVVGIAVLIGSAFAVCKDTSTYNYVHGIGEGSECFTNCDLPFGVCISGTTYKACAYQNTSTNCQTGTEVLDGNGQLVCVTNGGVKTINVTWPEGTEPCGSGGGGEG